MCASVCVYTCMHATAHGWNSEQFAGVSSLLPPCGSQRLNSVVRLDSKPPEPSHCLRFYCNFWGVLLTVYCLALSYNVLFIELNFASCLSFFSCHCDKVLLIINLREKGFVLAHSSGIHWARKSRQQELEALVTDTTFTESRGDEHRLLSNLQFTQSSIPSREWCHL